MTALTTRSPVPRYRVRVWFGEHAIADHIAEQALADRYEAAMRRRFASLRVTNEPLPSHGDGGQS